MLGQPHQQMAQKASVMAIGQSTYVTTETLRRLALLIDGRTVKIRVRYVYPLKKVKVVNYDHMTLTRMLNLAI